jgi:hypothetical protein
MGNKRALECAENGELRQKIDKAKQKHPDPSFELIETVASSGNGLVDLWEASPIRLDSNEPSISRGHRRFPESVTKTCNCSQAFVASFREGQAINLSCYIRQVLPNCSAIPITGTFQIGLRPSKRLESWKSQSGGV